MKKKEDHYSMKVSEGDADGKQAIEDIERDFKRLYFKMRRALTARAEYRMQMHAQTLSNVLSERVHAQAQAIEHACRDRVEGVETTEFAGAILALHAAAAKIESTPLPASLFDTQPEVKLEDETERYVEKKERRKRKKGSCSKESYTHKVYADRHYKRLALPNATGIGNEWSSGVRDSESDLWDTLGVWLQTALKSSANDFTQAVAQVNRSVTNTIDRRIEEVETRRASERDFWSDLGQTIEQSQRHADVLASLVRSQDAPSISVPSETT